jgi:hypothetical protein
VRFSKPGGDTGEADQRVSEALRAYAEGTGSEYAALTALAASRLLVPVVAVPGGQGGQGGMGGRAVPPLGGPRGGSAPRGQTEKESEMALPTLIGNDGRKAIIAFTGTESLRRWKEDARPVPAPASRVWTAGLSEADAVVIDVAGPVPLVVEGARLRALADGGPPPLPHEDPDIRAEVAAVTPEFTLAPGGGDTDLTVILPAADIDEAHRAAGELAARLAPRLRRGIEIRLLLSRTYPPDSPPPRRLV